MAQRDDILVEPTLSPSDATRPLKARLAAFVPITIAVLGIAAVMLGGVSARHTTTAEVPAIDNIATGSIAKD